MTTPNVPAPPKHDLGSLISRSIDLFKQDIGNWLVISVVGFFALGVGMWGGYHNCVLKAMRGEKPEVGDVLMPFSRFGDFFIPALLIGLSAGLLFWLCGLGIILAFVLSTWWFYAYPLMIERGMGWKEATEYSKAIVKQDLVGHFVLYFVAGIVGNIGGFIGLSFLTTVLTGMIVTFAYRDLFAGGGGPGGQQLPYGGGQPVPAAGAPMPQGAPQHAPAPQAGWGAPQGGPPQQQGAPQGAWGQPAPQAPAPQAPAPQAQGGWAPQAPAPQAPAPQAHAPQAPAPSPYVAPAAPQPGPPAGDGDELETATQATTTNPDEMVHGKTMAMSAMDFEKMLAEQDKKNQK